MSRFLRQLFRVEPGEGLKITQFALLGLLLQTGLAFGMAGADTLFLVHAGPEKLPYIYLLTPVMMLIYIPAYSALLSRWGLDRVMDCTLGVLIAGGAALWFTFASTTGAEPLWLCYAAKLYTSLWYIGIYTLFWNFIDGYFDLVDAKRYFSLFAAGSATGAIVGGSFVGTITESFGVQTLFLAWAICAALAWPVGIWTRRSWRKLDADDRSGATAPPLAQAAAAVRQLVSSRYAVVLTTVLFLTLVTATLCEYQYMGIFAANVDEVTLASLLGRLTAMVNVFNLGFSLFLFNRMVARLGVRNVALIQPVAYTLVFTWLLLNGGFPAAVAGFFAFQGLMTVIEFNNVNLMFSGLPVKGRKQIRTLIEGLCEPLATATAGMFLLFGAQRLSPEQLSLCGVIVGLVYLTLVFVLRIDYVKGIATNLRQDWLDFSRPAEPLLRQSTPVDLDLAESRVRVADPAGSALALRVLWLSDQPRAVRALLAFLRQAPPSALPSVQPLLEEILRQAGSASAQEIQRWLDEDDVTPEAGLAGELGRYRLLPERHAERLRLDGRPAARGAAAVALWQGWRVCDSRHALDQIEELLAADDEPSVLAGLRSLGQLGETRYTYLLRDHLRSSSPAVRRTALVALRALASPASRILLPELLVALADGTDEERGLALDAFERIGDASALGVMLTAVGTFTPAERRRAEQLILMLGPRCVPTLIAVIQDPNQTVTAHSVTLRALGKLALPQLQLLSAPLVDLTARKAYHFLGAYQSLAAEPTSDAGRAVLGRIYRDFPTLTLEIVLETLTVAGRLPSYEAIMAALKGGQSKDRGYAIEAIEQACSRETFALLLPLIDGRSIAAQVEFGRSRGLVPTLTPSQVIERSLQADFPLEAAAASAALYALDPAAAAEPLLTRLRKPPNRLLRETIVTLLARRLGRSSRTDFLTPVEVIDLLMQSPDLAGCMFMHHEFLASRASARSNRAGTVLCRRGEPLPGLWFVLTGAVQGDTGTVWRTGHAAGAAALHGALAAPETLTVTEELHSFFLPTTAFQRCVELFPELGLTLLRSKLAG